MGEAERNGLLDVLGLKREEELRKRKRANWGTNQSSFFWGMGPLSGRMVTLELVRRLTLAEDKKWRLFQLGQHIWMKYINFAAKKTMTDPSLHRLQERISMQGVWAGIQGQCSPESPHILQPWIVEWSPCHCCLLLNLSQICTIFNEILHFLYICAIISSHWITSVLCMIWQETSLLKRGFILLSQ